MIFLRFFEDSTFQGTLGKKTFSKKSPQNMFKTRLDLFWERFWAFLEFWKVFWFFWKFSTTRTSKEHWAKKLFRKNRPKTYSKHVWTLLGTIVDIFGILKVFLICLKIFEDSTFHRTLGKKTFEKITPKYVQNTFGQLWERFWVCLEFWKIFDFFENFRRLDPPWNTGQKIFRKKYPKTCSKHVWTFLGTILGFSAILKNFRFFWKFSKTRPSMEHWAKIFRKKYPKTCSKHVWTFLGTILDFSAILKNFRFFWKFSKTRPTKEHWAKKFSK